VTQIKADERRSDKTQNPGFCLIRLFRVNLRPQKAFKDQKTPFLMPRKGVFEEIFFGSPAVRFRGPIGFASPGYPGFTIIGKYLKFRLINLSPSSNPCAIGCPCCSRRI
jgi:hypothetical protein